MNATPPVKSDQTLLAILRIVHERGPTPLAEIAAETGVAESTAYNHLVMLQDQDFVTRDERGYRLGLRFLEYGLDARARHEISALAEKKVRELAETTGEKSWCVVEENGQAVYLQGASGEHSIDTHETVGSRKPLHCIASGKAILAHLPEKRREEIISKTPLEQVTEHTITDEDELRSELSNIRERGFAYNLEESFLGIHAIGAPVLDTDGSVYGAISIGGPANRLNRDRLETEFRDLILGTTNEMEVNIRDQ